MLSKETIEMYRRMTPGERLRLAFEMTDENQKYLAIGTHEIVERKFALIRKRNDEHNTALLKALKEAEARRHEFGY